MIMATYKEKHLMGAGLQFRGLVYRHHGRTWQHAGRHGAREAPEGAGEVNEQLTF